MQKILIALVLCCLLFACKLSNNNANMEDNKELAALFDKYYDERMQLFPLEATTNGDNRYNDQMPADFTDSYRARLKDFYTKYLNYLNEFERDHLNDNDKISYDILKYEMQMSLEGLSFHEQLYSGKPILGKATGYGANGKRLRYSAFQNCKRLRELD